MSVTDKKLQNHVTLLYWKKDDKEHYAWVKSLNRLLSKLNKHNGQMYFCKRCFQGFVRPGLLQRHEEMCRHFSAQATKTVDKEIKFTGWAKTEPTLFWVYGDFELHSKKKTVKNVENLRNYKNTSPAVLLGSWFQIIQMLSHAQSCIAPHQHQTCLWKKLENMWWMN